MCNRDRQECVAGFAMMNPNAGDVIQKAMELNMQVSPALAGAQQASNITNENMLLQSMKTAMAGNSRREPGS